MAFYKDRLLTDSRYKKIKRSISQTRGCEGPRIRLCTTESFSSILWESDFISLRGNEGLAFTSLVIMNLEVSKEENAVQ